MNEATRLKFCQIITGIIAADNELDPAERAFLDKMVREFGLDPAAVETLVPVMDSARAGRELLGMSTEAQAIAFSFLVQAATADGKYVAEERAYLHAVARVLGLPTGEVDDNVEAQLAARAGAGRANSRAPSE
jgi:uncharacterized membrane protein YebE (DUF533 family)